MRRTNGVCRVRGDKRCRRNSLCVRPGGVLVLGELPKGDMRAQLRNTFANITGLLDAADYPASQVIKIHIYVTDMDRALEAYDEVTGSLQQWGAAPASVMTEVGRLASVDMLCEIEAVAVR
ncbi:RidA family protein [Mycobacteroides chelonae]|nr:RidA family protein [Mycobacteroides chelonae]